MGSGRMEVGLAVQERWWVWAPSHGMAASGTWQRAHSGAGSKERGDERACLKRGLKLGRGQGGETRRPGQRRVWGTLSFRRCWA